MVVSGKNEVITFVRDITEQKLSAIEIQKSELRYRELFENSGTPIWEADFSNIINYLAELKGKGILDFQKYFDENFDEVIRCISMVRLVDANKEILNFLKADSKKQAMTGLLDFFTEESFETAKIVILELAKGKLKIGGEIPIKILTNEVKHVIFRIAIASKGNHTWAKSLISFINITAKKEAEKALLESEAKLEEATKIAKLATWEYDIAAKQFTFNEQFYSLLNTNAEREGGYQMSEKDYIQKFIHPEDADILRREEQKALKTNDPNYSSRFDHRILYTGGEVGNIMVNLRIEKDNSGQTKRIYGVKQDITDRIQAEESLKLFRKLIDNSNDAIEVIDINTGQYLDVNKKACYDLGYTRDELLNMKVFDIDPNQNPENFKQVRDGFRQSDSNLLETIHVRKDGTTFPVEVNITLVELEKTYIIAIVRDITERKHYEMELIKAKEKAEESDSLKSAFLANMSHEIRTPMNGILGFTELLKEPMLSGEEQRKYIDIIEKSGTRMLSIINDIISISKIEAGQVEVSVNNTNINDQLEYIYLFFKKEAKKKNIKLSVGDFLPKEEATIKTDREKIYAVLINLVKNAIKFTKEGSIIFGCGKKGEFLEFYVKDTGSGISEEKREIIFDRFRQGSENMNRDYEGAGLGLAICKGYLEMLGGKIWMYPNIYKDPKTGISYEKGSVFNFTIPLEINNNQKIKLDSMQDTEEMQNQNKKLKVLIVEDDEVSLLYINKIAKDFSKDILNAPNGIEAVKICQNNPDLDLILMDLKMPKMGGLEAATEIRGFNKDVIIIAQTAYGMSGDKEEAIEAGCNDYISKPIKRKELLELVNKYFE